MSTPLIWELSPEPDDYLLVLPLTKWIGEETKRNMPPYIYNYYLNQVRESRRKLLTVSLVIFHKGKKNFRDGSRSCENRKALSESLFSNRYDFSSGEKTLEKLISRKRSLEVFEAMQADRYLFINLGEKFIYGLASNIFYVCANNVR